MVQIRFSWCLVWFVSASFYFPSSVVLVARISASDDFEAKEIPLLLSWKGETDDVKYPRHDKNWWFWNQDSKEKPSPFGDSHRKVEKEIHKLEFKRLVHPFTPNIGPLRSLFSKEPLACHMVKKRWLSGSFGFCGRKKQHKESQKWLIDSQRSGPMNLHTTPVIQDPWVMPQKRMQIYKKDHQTDIPLRKFSAGPRINAIRKHDMPLQQKNITYHPAMSVDNILFRSFNHAYDKENNLDSLAYHPHQQVTRFPEQPVKTYGYLRPLPSSAYQQVWNKSRDPVWDRYMTPFGELKFNPLKQPYPFHDRRSSIKWYTTPRYRLVRTSEPPLEGQLVQNDHPLSPSAEKENAHFHEIMEAKGVAKSKDKKATEITERGRSHSEYALIPKIYALSQLRKSDKKSNDHYGWFADSVTNPIIVPGFKRKHAEAPDDEQFSLRPYNIRTEERWAPFDDEFIQVSRANRNQTKNVVSVSDNNKVTGSGVPIQLPSPYAFPGGVNISILVPNPPAPSSHETQLSTMTSTSTDRNIKKKKERKKKVKNDDESLQDVILSEPRSLVSARVNVKKFPYVEKTGINPLIGDDSRRIGGMQLINYGSQLNNTISNVKHPTFDWKTDNFSLLSHIRNLTLNELDWDTPIFDIQTEQVKKPFQYSEDDDDDDEIRMLYDEQTSSSTTLRSDEKQHMGQTVSFSWYRLTDYVPRTSSVLDFSGVGRLCPPSNVKGIPGFKFGGSGRVTPRFEDNKYLNVKHNPRNVDFIDEQNEQKCKRLARGERSDGPENGAIQLKKSDIPLTNFKRQNHDEVGHMDGKVLDGRPGDQWDALDEDLKSEMSGKGKEAAWQTRNRKREIDFSDNANDEQGYYRLSVGGNSFRNPTNLIMSAFRGKPNKHREREYYEDIPEERIREQMSPGDVASSNYPK